VVTFLSQENKKEQKPQKEREKLDWVNCKSEAFYWSAQKKIQKHMTMTLCSGLVARIGLIHHIFPPFFYSNTFCSINFN